MKTNENKRPITVEDHKEVARRHAEKKVHAVNEVLKFPGGDAFEEDLNAILNSDAEANGEIVAIALIDCDKFGIGDEGAGFFRQIRQVAANHQRGAHDAPQSEMGFLLCEGHSVAPKQH